MLMCNLEVDIGALCGASAAGILTDVWSRLSEMQGDGLVEIDGSRVRVTPGGRPYVRNVAACFDTYHRDAPSRHSRAV
jgi:oxygen-independent coproporphyrinogen-3 oxidase